MRYLTILFFLPLLVTPQLVAQENLEGVKSFSFQLQDIDLVTLHELGFDLHVIDYSKDGSDRQAFSKSELATLTASSKVVSYLSIGEAEDYRFYFKSKWIADDGEAPCGVRTTKAAPKWLDKSNKNWCGNYKVRFWQRKWKRIIYGRRSGARKSYLDRIIDNGFDGVYLDIIDGYEYWGSKRRDSYPLYAKRMAKFVIELANYARDKREKANFIIIPQNGSGILEYLDQDLRSAYLSTIDGIGAEDSFFFGPKDIDNSYSPQELTIEWLRQYISVGKPVLAIEYVSDPDYVSLARIAACTEGFLLQVAPRALDSANSFAQFSCDA
ncbi:MAG: endo alpha-1,4 polygalactosaminidase [Bdellovibrionales bacterium]|nr:endo alpha-1,4 polygalactosaminidase [Bdellovibrionales bacterium]